MQPRSARLQIGMVNAEDDGKPLQAVRLLLHCRKSLFKAK